MQLEDSVEIQCSPPDICELREYFEDFEKFEHDYEESLSHDEMQEHLETVDYVLPRLLLTSFVVVLWAVYEAAVKELAECLGCISGQHLKISDLFGDFTKKSRNYFEHILGIDLYSSYEVRERLERIEMVRHAIAHANGRLTEVRPDNRKKLNMWIKEDRGISEERGCLMLSKDFVRQGYADVNREIERLIALAKPKIDSSKSDALNKTSDTLNRRKEVALETEAPGK